MRSPASAVKGLGAALATICAVGIAFPGDWGFLAPTPWRSVDIVVVMAALGGFAALGLVPWIATAPTADEGGAKPVVARRACVGGVAGIWLAVAFSLPAPQAK